MPGSLGPAPRTALEPMLTIEWNDPEAFTAALSEHGDTIAAVVMEPMMLNAGAIGPPTATCSTYASCAPGAASC